MTDASDAVIVAAVRTPIGRSGRSLAGLSSRTSACRRWPAAIAAAGLDADDIDDLLLGEVLQGGGCTARYVANALGLPPDTPGGAVQRQCATGMMAVQDAAATHPLGHGRGDRRRRRRVHDPLPAPLREVAVPLRRRRSSSSRRATPTRPRRPT